MNLAIPALVILGMITLTGCSQTDAPDTWAEAVVKYRDTARTYQIEAELHRLLSQNDLDGVGRLDKELQAEMGRFGLLHSDVLKNGMPQYEEISGLASRAAGVGAFENAVNAQDALAGLGPCEWSGILIRTYVSQIVTGHATYQIKGGRVRPTSDEAAADNYAEQRWRCATVNRADPGPELVGDTCFTKGICADGSAPGTY